MSQIARGHCIEEFATRPELNPSWFGKITPIPRAQAPCKEISRRSDGLIAKFFSGTPKLASARRDQWGLSANYTPLPHLGTSPQDHGAKVGPTSVFTQLRAVPRWGIKVMSQG